MVLAPQEGKPTIAELNTLDDAMLKDIGLHRSGIEAAVRGGQCRSGPRKWTAPDSWERFPAASIALIPTPP